MKDWVKKSIMIALDRDRDNIGTILKMIGLDGGKGSGNFGHKGRPGMVGGSGEGGGGSSGSSESSGGEEYNSKEFKSIAEKAKKSTDKSKFIKSLSAKEYQALVSQHSKSSSDESFTDYVDRMHRMLSVKPEGGKKTNKPVDGKDISDHYADWDGKPYTGETGQVIDTMIEDVLEKQGFMGVPKVVSSDEFDRITREHPEMPVLFRSYTAPTPEALADYDRQLESGEWYVDCKTGGAQYGQGMYTAGVFRNAPMKLDDPKTNPFNGTGDRYVIGGDGKTYQLGNAGDVDFDRMEAGRQYLLSKRETNGDNTNRMVEMYQDSSSGKMMLKDVSTGETLDWGKTYDDFDNRMSVMCRCEEVDPEKPLDVDTSGAMEEMKHYRKINEDKVEANYKPPIPDGMSYVGEFGKGMEVKWHYYDSSEGKSFDEAKPEPGSTIVTFDSIGHAIMWNVAEDGSLYKGERGKREAKNQFESERWAYVKGEADNSVECQPSSSTRRMTMHPSSKIITHGDLEIECSKHLKQKESEYFHESMKELLDENGITGQKRKDIEQYCEYSLQPSYKFIEERKALEEKFHGAEVLQGFVQRVIDRTQDKSFTYEMDFDFGAYAASLGYDAIDAGGHGQSGSYVVVLNRTKVILCKDRVDVA